MLRHFEFQTPTGSLTVSETLKTKMVAITIQNVHVLLSRAQFEELAELAISRYGTDYIRYQQEPQQSKLPLE